MNITNDLIIYNLCLYSKQHNTLIFSDVHIGYEESLNKQGVLIPRFQFKEIIQLLEKTILSIKAQQHVNDFDRIIINGDIKHEFGKISEQEWRHTLKLLDFLGKHTDAIILVRGNHDTILGPIAKKRNVETPDHYLLGELLFVHGDKEPEAALLEHITTIIIGHQHPAVSIREGARVETFRCFLKGRHQKKTIIVLPSCNLLAEGIDIIKEKPFSPVLPNDLANFQAFLIADRIYKPIQLKNLL